MMATDGAANSNKSTNNEFLKILILSEIHYKSVKIL
jgi:hypothetical protein